MKTLARDFLQWVWDHIRDHLDHVLGIALLALAADTLKTALIDASPSEDWIIDAAAAFAFVLLSLVVIFEGLVLYAGVRKVARLRRMLYYGGFVPDVIIGIA